MKGQKRMATQGSRWMGGLGGSLPPAQAPLGQLHLGQPMVTEHSYSGDGG